VTQQEDGPGRLAAEDRWAVWQGVAYPCWGPPALWPRLALRARDDGRAPVGLDRLDDGSERRYVHVVDPDLLDAWHETRWTFRWRGEPFESRGMPDPATARGHYEGEDEEFARLHLNHPNHREGDYPLDEITDVVEHRTDLRALREERLRLLAETDGYRPRAFAVVDGVELPAAMEADASGHVAVGEPDARRLLPIEELEAWWRVHWTFVMDNRDTLCGNHPFRALGPERDCVKGEYIGNATYGLVMHTYLLNDETGPDGYRMYTSHCYPDRLTELTEHRTDLLGD
jgi:hypothetical protein